MLVENGVVNINERDDKGSTPAHKGTTIALDKGRYIVGNVSYIYTEALLMSTHNIPYST